MRSRALLGALLGALLVVVASPAWAHDELIGSDPAQDAVIDTLPEQIELTFSGILLNDEGATEMVVRDATGIDLTAGDPELDGVHVIQPLSGEASGVITVQWRVVSSDGHPISDEFTFTVGTGDGEPGPTQAPAPPLEATDMTGWLWAGGIAIVVVVGILLALFLSRSRPAHED